MAEHGFSRYPVRGRRRALLGFVHVKDVLDAEARDRPIADEHITPFVEFGAGDALPEVLATMRRAGTHLGRVRRRRPDDGLVALEDVLEQLIGDVRDAAVERGPPRARSRRRGKMTRVTAEPRPRPPPSPPRSPPAGRPGSGRRGCSLPDWARGRPAPQPVRLRRQRRHRAVRVGPGDRRRTARSPTGPTAR